ncbi:major facilitator superfamily domain-containing protein 10 isoform X4 [Mustela nigripes]|uniref:major facilitator superfamily domain-containing protein 10 isoform X4 n=1 Tax=Mustela nigripes TaxID=77151 RepID=UPI0028156001|nr:major facilitator superfamily domain-containing protein 10 isoform X4 [Mustela nigripes]
MRRPRSAPRRSQDRNSGTLSLCRLRQEPARLSSEARGRTDGSGRVLRGRGARFGGSGLPASARRTATGTGFGIRRPAARTWLWGPSRVSRRSRHPAGRAGASGARPAAAALEGLSPPPPCPGPRDTGVCARSPGPARRRPRQQPRNTRPRGRSCPSTSAPRPERAGRKRKQPAVATSGAGGVVSARPAPDSGPGGLFGIRPSVGISVFVCPPRARGRARRDHGLGSRRELHPAPTHPPADGAGDARDRCGVPRPPAGPSGLHSAAAPAARAAGEPRPRPRPPLWLVAAGSGLVCRCDQDAGREEVQQRPLRRSHWLGLLLPAVPLGSTHGGDLGLSGEAPRDAAVPGSHRGGLLTGLHPGPHAGCLPAHGDSTLAGPALRCLQPAVHFLFSARDSAPREAAAWPPVLPPPQAPSITPGFRAAADLLSPLALLRFSAVAQGQDPPAGDRLESLRRLGLVYFLYLFLFSGLEYTLSFLAHQRFQFSSLQQGKMFFFIGLTMAAVQGAYARRISPGGEIAAVKRAILLLVPAFLLIGWGLMLPVLGLGLLLYSFAAAVVVPCLSSVVANYGSSRQKGTIMGTLRSLGALARAVGPMVAASAYWLAGAQVCFTVCSGLFLLPFLLLWNLRPPAHTLKAE